MRDSELARRPVATYSIVAMDDSGSLGVAVQSHWFNVGAVVPWVERGVGAVAVQSISDPATGRRALELLQAGTSAGSVIAALLAEDADGAYRQIAVVDASGEAAAHTGELCIPEAGHQVAPAMSTQANLMDRPTVWGAMADAFRTATGDLADRMLGALEAAEAEGGDVRGRQSAALVVVPSDADGAAFDIRVEDSPDPLAELRRLVALQRAYHALNRGDAMMARGAFDEALAAYDEATRIVSDEATDGEAAFWAGIAFANTGRLEDAERLLARAATFGDRWSTLLPRLVRSKMLPDDDQLVARLLGVMRR